eukprot:11822986-Heterocapsa_arctica.AAC.1
MRSSETIVHLSLPDCQIVCPPCACPQAKTNFMHLEHASTKLAPPRNCTRVASACTLNPRGTIL